MICPNCGNTLEYFKSFRGYKNVYICDECGSIVKDKSIDPNDCEEEDE